MKISTGKLGTLLSKHLYLTDQNLKQICLFLETCICSLKVQDTHKIRDENISGFLKNFFREIS